LADGVFKDGASINRILELLVQSGYVKKKNHTTDLRKYSLLLTAAGLKTLNGVAPIVAKNRKQALKGIDPKKIKNMKKTLQIITKNCAKTAE
jgi:MarR family transcriptional regulator for hemolysin